MKALLRSIERFGADESAATAIEYGLIAALIAASIIAGVGALGNGVNGLFGTTQDSAGAAIAAAAGSMN